MYFINNFLFFRIQEKTIVIETITFKKRVYEIMLLILLRI